MIEKFIVLDTETANSLDDPIVYDIGWAVVDKDGNVYQTYSYVVADVFLNKELMASAYFADKIPQYQKDLDNEDRALAKFSTIKAVFARCVKENNVKKVFAHNMRFDYRSTNTTQRYLTKSANRYFFPYGLEICDTLKMARATLKNNVAYDNFCYDNHYLTKRGCKRYTAEIIYRFLTENVNFEEEHTGLEDVLIEKEILAFCFREDENCDGKLW